MDQNNTTNKIATQVGEREIVITRVSDGLVLMPPVTARYLFREDEIVSF